MHMGHYAATNIHGHMLAECGGGKPKFLTLSPFPSMMGLALGKKAVTYNPTDGTRDGEDLMASMFGEDMGNTGKWFACPGPSPMLISIAVCWNYMRLREPCQV